MWFAAAFPLFSFGLSGLIEKGLWPNLDFAILYQSETYTCNPLLALSQSLWINIFGGYAFSMMITHEYFNKAIAKGKIISLTTFVECMTGPVVSSTWFRFIPLTIFLFWIAAHTITYLLPVHYYVLFAATLSMTLGFIITIIKK